MKRHHLLFLLLVIFTACQKDLSNDLIDKSQDGLKEKVLSFLNKKQNKVSTSTKDKIEALKSKINWNNQSHYSRTMGGIQTFVELKTNGLSGSREANDIFSALSIEQDVNGNIVLVSIYELLDTEHSQNPGDLLSRLINHYGSNFSNYSGFVRKKFLNDRLVYEVDFDNGRISGYKNLKTKTSANGTGRVAQCVDWYLQTYIDGELFSEVYLYTDCGVEENGGGGGGTGEGGGEGENNEWPENHTQNPCEAAVFLLQNTAVNDRMSTLSTIIPSSTFESAYMQMTLPNNTHVWQALQSPANFPNQIPTLHFDPGAPRLDAYLHNHWGNDSYNMFSASDLATLYGLFIDDHINENFVFGVATGNGNYALVIENPAQFEAYGAAHLNDYLNYSILDLFTYSNYGIYTGMDALSSEAGLAKLLQEEGTGLKLLKGNADGTTWFPIKYFSTLNIAMPDVCL